MQKRKETRQGDERNYIQRVGGKFLRMSSLDANKAASPGCESQRTLCEYPAQDVSKAPNLQYKEGVGRTLETREGYPFLHGLIPLTCPGRIDIKEGSGLG